MLIFIKAVIAACVLILVYGLGFLTGRSYQVIYRREQMLKKARRREEKWQREAEKADRINYIYNSTASVTGAYSGTESGRW